MSENGIKVLLVEDNPAEALLLTQELSDTKIINVNLIHVERLAEVFNRVRDYYPDLILLDLFLPDSSGLKTFLNVYEAAPDVPIIVMAKISDERLAVQAVQEGAQDYVIKDTMDGDLLVRSMRFAMERQKLLDQLRSASIVDELTGLYNRQGFITFADHELKVANRTSKPLLLVIAELDTMKTINDTLGRYQGDLALMETANILRESFRETDVLSRLGGDQFAALVSCGTDADLENLAARFREIVDQHNDCDNRSFELSLTLGITPYDPQSPCHSEELLEQADRLMFEQKRLKRKL